MIERGNRSVGYVDIESAEWEVWTSMGGARRTILSRDPVSGADTHAFWVPAGFAVNEKAHFADCDHEFYQFDGDFFFDEITPVHEGDYLYRPAGTVCGDNEHAEAGGTMIIHFARDPGRFHFDDAPKPWPGEYLVDRVWNKRPVEPAFVRTADLAWRPSALGNGIEERRIRGVPGDRSPLFHASSHSPWAADAALILRIPAGYRGPFPNWPETTIEILAIAGRAAIGDNAWRRGCYAFGAPAGECHVSEDLVLYARTFAKPYCDPSSPAGERGL